MPEGIVGKGSTHHFALRVDSEEEQEAWRDYLREHDVDCTDVFDRGEFRSIYVSGSRRPRGRDRHAASPASAPAGRPLSGPTRRRRFQSPRLRDQGVALSSWSPLSRFASSLRWRSVIDPMVLVSTIGIEARNRRQRVRPQRCWLISRSAIAHALRLPRPLEHDLGHGCFALCHLALELGAREPHAVGLRERPHVLWRRCCRSCFHRTSPLNPTLARWGPSFACPRSRARADTGAAHGPRTRQCGVPDGHPMISSPACPGASLTRDSSASRFDRGSRLARSRPAYQRSTTLRTRKEHAFFCWCCRSVNLLCDRFRQGTVLGFELLFDVLKRNQRAVQDVSVVGRHHARAQQRAARAEPPDGSRR